MIDGVVPEPRVEVRAVRVTLGVERQEHAGVRIEDPRAHVDEIGVVIVEVGLEEE
jgi:hypothetical protein